VGKVRNAVLVAVVAFMTGSLAPAAAQTPPVSGTTVRIHTMGPLTKGPLVATHKEALASAQAYIDQVNARGGVAGRKIELVHVDDQQEPALADSLAKALVEKDEVLSFFLLRTSPTNQAVMKYAEPARVPNLAAQVGPNFLYDPAQRMAFTVRASYEAELLRAIELQLRFGRNRFAFLAANDSYGNPLVEAATRVLTPLKITPLVEKVDNRAADIAPALASFGRAKPDVIFLICSAVCASDFVKRYKAQGGTAQFVTLSNNSSNAFMKALGEAGRGVIVMQVMPLPTSKTIKVSKDYQALAAEAKIEPSYNGLVGYVGARVLVEALRRAGKNLTRESFVSALESMRQFDLGDFVIGYGPSDRIGSSFIEETIISRDGTFLR
jgi:ABC-type branched-subunit amino acid transport system substrate-binding protein